ncbi:MAG: glycosyltransferase family 2 protein [Anaerolineales bacterium]
MDLAIVIVSYNVHELTRACLQSVYAALRHSGLEGQVWVVDNASADGSAAMVATEFPQATLCALADNRGYAAGANEALRQLMIAEQAPRYVLVLNPDTVLAPDALGQLVSFMQKHPQVGLAGAQLAYADGSFQHGAFHFPTLLMLFLDFWPLHHRLLDSPLNGRYPRRRYDRGEPFPIDHPLGAAMLIRHETLADVGLLDESYFMYCEEIDYCLRVRRAGWAIYLVPAARITHYAGQSTRQFREQMFLALWRSRLLLFDRYYSRVYRWLARRIIAAGMHSLRRATEREVAQGTLSAREAAPRLDAYRQVLEWCA